VAILWTVSSYSLVIYMPTYVQKAFAYTPSEAFLSSLVCNILMVFVCVAGGIASDRIGRQKVLIASGLWLAVTSVPARWMIQTQHNLMGLMAGQIIVSIGVGVYVGVAPSALAELFPPRVRSTAVSVCYNLAVTLFSGFGPALLTWAGGQGVSFAPGWYVLFAAVLATPALIALKPTNISELAAEPA
jgi:MHS family proline/betaine transporter-like MFS transporter